MSGNEQAFSLVRRRIERALEVAEEERRQKLLSFRLDFVRTGIIAFQKGNYVVAVQNFHAYIKILEDTKNVGEGGLIPSCFDLKKEAAELMMISGVYWDLSKIYDHAKSPAKHREFLQYIEKYIIFSKGLTFQPLCAETLRRYISNRKPIHMADFKRAYDMLSVSKCFVASSLVDVIQPHTVLVLRRFRDQSLEPTGWGRALIQWYGRNGPKLAVAMNRLPWAFRKAFALVLDLIAFFLSEAQNSSSQ